MPSPLGNAIRAFRDREDLSINQLAALVGVSYATAWNWENRDQQPRPAAINELLEIGCDIKPYIVPPVTGKTIRQWRESNNLQKQQLAELLNVHPSAVSAWEHKRKMPSPPVRRDLFALGCPSDDGRRITTGQWGGCDACPKRAACEQNIALGLWCLCEVDPPTAADLLRAHQIDPVQYPLDDRILAEALDRIPDPPAYQPSPMETLPWD